MALALRLPIPVASIRCSQRLIPYSSSGIPIVPKSKFSTSSSSHKWVDKECDDLLPWLRRKAGAEISSMLSVGKSIHGRSLFASKSIKAGKCILKVPYSVHLVPDDLLPKIKSLLGDKVGCVAKLALVILVQQKMGQDSEWAPYISRLPQAGEMHGTMFWSDNELKMIQKSSLYQETIKRKEEVEKDFLVIKPVLDHLPEIFKHATLKDFKHAYGLVVSRAWIGTRGVSMIPFADFLNHDVVSESDLLCDEDKESSQVIADRNYAPGDQVFIRYGKFSNATLLLDFGFTLPCNKYDQVQLEFVIPDNDLLYLMKSELLRSDNTPTVKDSNGLGSLRNCFTIKEVLSASGKGKGIPQSLRAFGRVLCCTTPQELHDLATEAAQNDGRLARRPFKNRAREIQSHQLLLSRVTQIIDEHNAFIKSLEPPSSSCFSGKHVLRMQLARELLTGELRVLGSASAWLQNYCRTLAEI